MWYTAVVYWILLPAPYDGPQSFKIEQASTASTVNLTYQPPKSPNGDIDNYTVCYVLYVLYVKNHNLMLIDSSWVYVKW